MKKQKQRRFICVYGSYREIDKILFIQPKEWHYDTLTANKVWHFNLMPDTPSTAQFNEIMRRWYPEEHLIGRMKAESKKGEKE